MKKLQMTRTALLLLFTLACTHSPETPVPPQTAAEGTTPSWEDLMNDISLGKKDALIKVPDLLRTKPEMDKFEIEVALALGLKNAPSEILAVLRDLPSSTTKDKGRFDLCQTVPEVDELEGAELLTQLRTEINELRMRAQALSAVREKNLLLTRNRCLKLARQAEKQRETQVRKLEKELHAEPMP